MCFPLFNANSLPNDISFIWTNLAIFSLKIAPQHHTPLETNASFLFDFPQIAHNALLVHNSKDILLTTPSVRFR
jgi:hypothetical protein